MVFQKASREKGVGFFFGTEMVFTARFGRQGKSTVTVFFTESKNGFALYRRNLGVNFRKIFFQFQEGTGDSSRFGVYRKGMPSARVVRKAVGCGTAWRRSEGLVFC